MMMRSLRQMLLGIIYEVLQVENKMIKKVKITKLAEGVPQIRKRTLVRKKKRC